VILLLWQHLAITAIALAISLLIALPIGLLIYRSERVSVVVLGILGILYTIPSIALIILLIPIFGLEPQSVIAALVLYTQVILVRNLVIALRSIDAVILEAAKGMGMNAWQRWQRVQLPLALPVMIAGLRIAAIVSVGITTIGAKFGAGGLGVLLFEGIAESGRYDKIWAGAISVAVLALALNIGFLWLEKTFGPRRYLLKTRSGLNRIQV
jgi:osmoprotectant transport system permease protein